MTDTRDVDPVRARDRVLSDPFLLEVYSSCLRRMVLHTGLDAASINQFAVVELGSAGGITKDLLPTITTSDVRESTGVDLVFSGESLPFSDDSLDAILAKDTLHHIPDPEEHFREVLRVLKPGACAVYLEPNWNWLSRLVFTRFHPEPFDLEVQSWGFESHSPMDSNQGLAHNIFIRDAPRFARIFPTLEAEVLEPDNGLAYLASGGVHTRTRVPPSWLIPLRNWEAKRPRVLGTFGVNRYIRVRKVA